jgi:hypothetical protein
LLYLTKSVLNLIFKVIGRKKEKINGNKTERKIKGNWKERKCVNKAKQENIYT